MNRGARHFVCVGIMSTLTAAVVITSGCSGNSTAEKPGKEPMAVQIYRTKRELITEDITSFGSLMHTRKNDITAAVEGVIDELPFREGAAIQEGAVLARLSNIQLTINFEQAKAALAGAKASTALAGALYRDYRSQLEARFLALEKTDRELVQRERQLNHLRTDVENSEVLHLVGGVSGDQLRTVRYSLSAAESEYEKLRIEKEILLIGLRDSDITRAGFTVPEDEADRRSLLVDLNSRTKHAELQVAQAQEEMAETQKNSAEALVHEMELTAPSGGIVGAVYKERGERVETGEKICTIIESGHLWAVFPVNEKDAARLKTGMPAAVSIEALGDETVPAVVDTIAPTVDPQSGNVSIKALLENPEGNARPGMFTRIRVPSGEAKEKILIPRDCLVQQEEARGVVITVNNNRVFRRKVELGREYSDRTEIRSGLRTGEILVVDPTPLLHEGDEVVIHETE